MGERHGFKYGSAVQVTDKQGNSAICRMVEEFQGKIPPSKLTDSCPTDRQNCRGKMSYIFGRRSGKKARTGFLVHAQESPKAVCCEGKINGLCWKFISMPWRDWLSNAVVCQFDSVVSYKITVTILIIYSVQP